MNVDQLVAAIAEEFDLGAPVRWEDLPGGRPDVIRLSTPRGDFVVKPVYRSFEAELYANVESTLNSRGIRQPRMLSSPAGSYVSDSGHCVLEWLPGDVCLQPDDAQSLSMFRYLAAYDSALADIAVPAELDASDTVFNRVASPRYLVSNLPDLLGNHAPPNWDPCPIHDALAIVARATPDMDRLPTQLVHGDVGPDNVLYDGDSVVAIIDFTPHHQPVLFGVCTALYWYHVYGHGFGPDLNRIHAALRVYAARRAGTDLERRLWPAMLLREALRRLATPLALAEETGRKAPSNAAANNRFQAVRALLSAVPAQR